MKESFKDSFKAIGTTWFIDFKHTDSLSAVGIFDSVKNRIEVFEQQYSRFRKDSLVSQIAAREGVYILPNDAEPMFTMYKKLYDITGGKMTPLIGQTLVDAGYDAEYSLTPKPEIRKIESWDSSIRFTQANGINTLIAHKSTQLDFGALGKGYIVDIVSELLLVHGITDFTVEAGGDMRYQNTEHEVLRIGLEHPLDAKQVIGVAELTHGSICGSSGNRRAWSTYHHIINPDTLISPREISAVWVFAKDTITADALTTALFFVDVNILNAHFTYEYVIMYADGSAVISQGFPGSLF
ncbi:MAG: FAD:protein FMN transferase [Patescibacteria group bacterium]